jgi:hypothetical protein
VSVGVLTIWFFWLNRDSDGVHAIFVIVEITNPWFGVIHVDIDPLGFVAFSPAPTVHVFLGYLLRCAMYFQGVTFSVSHPIISVVVHVIPSFGQVFPCNQVTRENLEISINFILRCSPSPWGRDFLLVVVPWQTGEAPAGNGLRAREPPSVAVA